MWFVKDTDNVLLCTVLKEPVQVLRYSLDETICERVFGRKFIKLPELDISQFFTMVIKYSLCCFPTDSNSHSDCQNNECVFPLQTCCLTKQPCCCFSPPSLAHHSVLKIIILVQTSAIWYAFLQQELMLTFKVYLAGDPAFWETAISNQKLPMTHHPC